MKTNKKYPYPMKFHKDGSKQSANSYYAAKYLNPLLILMSIGLLCWAVWIYFTKIDSPQFIYFLLLVSLSLVVLVVAVYSSSRTSKALHKLDEKKVFEGKKTIERLSIGGRSSGVLKFPCIFGLYLYSRVNKSFPEYSEGAFIIYEMFFPHPSPLPIASLGEGGRLGKDNTRAEVFLFIYTLQPSTLNF